MVSNHRSHGHYLAWTDDVEGLVAEMTGRETGACGGRGAGQHLYASSFLSNGILGGMLPTAAGIALSRRIKHDGSIVVVFVGDGAFGEGVLYETFNLAACWHLPLLVVLENNKYAQSTPQHEVLAGDIQARAAAFGLATQKGDTWDWPGLLNKAQTAVGLVRNHGQPTLLQIDTYRLAPHSKGDDTRDPEEIAHYVQIDPINRILGSPPATKWMSTLKAIDMRIDAAVGAAEAANVQNITSKQGDALPASIHWSEVTFEREKVVLAIRSSLAEAMRADERVILIGEDVRSPYGGAFKVTEGLSEDFPDRTLNTPISEAAIVGVGAGLALEGYRPIVEIMFGDFMLLAADQLINHALKFEWIYNGQVSVPLLVRTPMGGKRGYGPTHSQSLEKHFLGIPGSRIIAVHQRYSASLTYKSIFSTIDRPVIVIENKTLYGAFASCEPHPGFVVEQSSDAFPTVRIKAADDSKPDVTLVTYGGMVGDTEAAMYSLLVEQDILCELVIPLQLYPLDISGIAASVEASGRIVVIEEGHGFSGFGSEVLSQLLERNPHTPFRAKRVTAAEHPIPASRDLEERTIPNKDAVVQGILDIMHG